MQRWRPLIGLVITAFVAVLASAACSGGGDGPTSSSTPVPDDSTSSSTTPAPDDLEAKLAGTLLTEHDVPAGLQRAGLSYSTNKDVAGDNADELQRLDRLGRILGVDVSLLPTQQVTPDIRGMQNSVSVYQSAEGASQSWMQTVDKARANDWAANYPDLSHVTVTELPRVVGDESVWFRVAGTDKDGQLVFNDQLVLRAGAARALVAVLSVAPPDSPPEMLVSQVAQWAETVVQRIRQTFPGGSPGA